VRIKKLNIEIYGHDLYIEEHAPIRVIRKFFMKGKESKIKNSKAVDELKKIFSIKD